VVDPSQPRRLADLLKQLSIVGEGTMASEHVLTGLVSVDEILGGFRRGALYVVAGRPSMGKTSFLLRLVENATLQQKKSVLLFAPECSATDTVQAMLRSRARVDRWKDLLSEGDHQRIKRAADEYHEANISIDDTAEIPFVELEGRVRAAKADCVVVDGAHLVRVEPRWLSLSAPLKRLARELGIPLVVTAPVHRRAEGRVRMRPWLGDVYGVGNAETDADAVLLLWREEYYVPRPVVKGICEAMIVKNRFGSTGAANMSFQPGSGRME
jgi:replicative DNA helicase